MHPSLSVFGELKQKLLFVAPVGDMPNMARQKMTISAWHGSFSLKESFLPPKGLFKAKYHLIISVFY